MAIHAVVILALQAAPIGSALGDGVQLIYESAGAEQTPWIYDSVRDIVRDGFNRCVIVTRRAQPARETCVRGDTLFEGNTAGGHRAVRPVGSNMRLVVAAGSGNTLYFSTDEVTVRRVADSFEVAVVPTTIVTRDEAGTIVRRLREDYAPALLTAVWGAFEEPDTAGGWTIVREFALREVRRTAQSRHPATDARSDCNADVPKHHSDRVCGGSGRHGR